MGYARRRLPHSFTPVISADSPMRVLNFSTRALTAASPSPISMIKSASYAVVFAIYLHLLMDIDRKFQDLFAVRRKHAYSCFLTLLFYQIFYALSILFTNILHFCFWLPFIKRTAADEIPLFVTLLCLFHIKASEDVKHLKTALR